MIKLIPPQAMACLARNLIKHYPLQLVLQKYEYESYDAFIHDCIELHLATYSLTIEKEGGDKEKLEDARKVYRQNFKTSYNFDLNIYETAKLVKYILDNCDVRGVTDVHNHFSTLLALKDVWYEITFSHLYLDMFYAKADNAPFMDSEKHKNCIKSFFDSL